MSYFIILVLTLVTAINTLSLYNSFSSYINVNKQHLVARQNKSTADLVLNRGIWLIKNGYQPSPYDRNKYQDNNFTVELEPGVTVRSKLTIDLVTKGTNHMDSTYNITAETGGVTKTVQFANGKVVSYT